jgi:hypothetical protein
MRKTLSIVVLLAREHKAGHKEIDHVLPFLYLLQHHLTKALDLIDIRVIFSTYRSLLSDRSDRRIDFLKNLDNVELIDLECPRAIQAFVHVAKLLQNYRIAKPVSSVCRRMLRWYDKKYARSAIRRETLGDRFFAADVSLVLTTNLSWSVKNAIDTIRALNPNTQTCLIPHGTIVCDNEMIHDDHVQKESLVSANPLLNYPDQILLTSERDKTESIAASMKPSIGQAIGSPRYCSEWLLAKRAHQIDGPLHPRTDCKKNILFLLPKPFINIWHEELSRTIHLLASYSDFEIILNGDDPDYPRLPNPDHQYTNLQRFMIGRKYSTSALIEWADAVFHAGTGVIFDSFAKNKITVLPCYITANVLISERYSAGVNLHCRDDLRDFCNRLSRSVEETEKFYSGSNHTGTRKYVNDYIEADESSVGENIAKAIESLISKNSSGSTF